MSDLLTAAAAALGVPEGLVKRAAEARATETGASADEILTAWAGGAPAPAATQSPSEAIPPAEPTTDIGASPPEVVIEVPTAPTPLAPVAVAPAGPYKPPVLVGAADNPVVVVAGIVGLFLIVLLVGLVGPSVQTANPGARSSEIDFTLTAQEGRHLYMNLGCAECHTQMVRPVVADVDLGAVTLNDTNQVLGTRRFGPDLSNVGARLTSAQVSAVVAGLDDHPPHTLSEEDMTALNAYLTESITSEGQ
jgi:cytochrome c oxidase cbb3-type subunit II